MSQDVPEALQFADDRPTSTDDDLYQWAVDAEDLIRRQHAEIERLTAEWDERRAQSERWFNAAKAMQAERDALRAELAALRVQKPVAWVEVHDTDEGPYEFHGIRLMPKGRSHLYAAPQPPAQAKRLSADEIRATFLSHGFEIKPGFDDLKPYVYDAARAVESACAAAWGVKLEGGE